ncbi:MAG: branched-chain amino acid ABC transporter permease [Anaerolineales bacterium]|nr:branched-chain amino acid ABC transporter permease [Anaerolineales bacterium]
MELVDVWNVLAVGLVRGGLYAQMALMLALVLGVMSIISMINGELYMIGAYVSYFAFTLFGLNPILSIACAAVATFLVGALIERGPLSMMRRRAGEDWYLNTFLLTVGLSFFLKNAAMLLWKPTYRGIRWYWEGTVSIGSIGISIDRLVALGIAALTIVALQLFLRNTRLGRAIRAVSQDERGAMLNGININTIYTISFGLACMLGGIAGGSMLSILPASPYMGTTPNNYAWLVVMLAGLGNISGAVVGGFIIGIVESVAFQFFGEGWPNVISFIILIIVLVIKPSGIFGTSVKGVWEQ